MGPPHLQDKEDNSDGDADHGTGLEHGRSELFHQCNHFRHRISAPSALHSLYENHITEAAG